VTDDDFFNLLNQNILETDTARKPPPEEEHLNLEEKNDFADTVGLLHDPTMSDAEQVTPYPAGHWQGDEAHDGDADDDHYQTFNVDEDHDTYLSQEKPEKKQFKSDEVHSPDVFRLTQFLTKPPPPQTNS